MLLRGRFWRLFCCRFRIGHGRPSRGERQSQRFGRLAPGSSLGRIFSFRVNPVQFPKLGSAENFRTGWNQELKKSYQNARGSVSLFPVLPEVIAKGL